MKITWMRTGADGRTGERNHVGPELVAHSMCARGQPALFVVGMQPRFGAQRISTPPQRNPPRSDDHEQGNGNRQLHLPRRQG